MKRYKQTVTASQKAHAGKCLPHLNFTLCAFDAGEITLVKVRTLLLTKLLIVVLAALVIGYWSGIEEWRLYERYADLSFAEAKAQAVERFEKPGEPAPIWQTMLAATGILILVLAAYEAVSLLLTKAVSKLKKRTAHNNALYQTQSSGVFVS